MIVRGSCTPPWRSQNLERTKAIDSVIRNYFLGLLTRPKANQTIPEHRLKAVPPAFKVIKYVFIINYRESTIEELSRRSSGATSHWDLRCRKWIWIEMTWRFSSRKPGFFTIRTCTTVVRSWYSSRDFGKPIGVIAWGLAVFIAEKKFSCAGQ